ncbi:MAG: hypothetical protein E4G94_01455 [ANME-2 cluster archaeon]|nr:MAG: hypothetical protein E4G94_01455 [ANME-2 cluster archaeon]
MISLSKKKEWEEPCNQLIIDLNAIQSNYQYLKSKLPVDCVFYAVLKTDAYGHGIIEVSNALARVGCQHFAVDTPHEGIQLRKQGFAGEILLLNPIPGWMAETAVYHDLSVSVIHPSILDSLEKAAQNLEKKVKIHVAVNVGLNRLGISSSGLMEIVNKISSTPSLKFEGLYGQARDHTSAKQSYEQLCSLYRKLKSTGVVPKHLHFPTVQLFSPILRPQ